MARIREPSAGADSRETTLEQRILGAAERRSALESLDIPRHEGRVDLRGISFPKPSHLQRYPYNTWYKFEGPVTFIENNAKIREASVENLDLSFADLRWVNWYNCKFRNALFEGAELAEDRFHSCHFEQTSFERADLREAVVDGDEPCKFRNVSFLRTDLRYIYLFRFPRFEDCDFSWAKWTETDFQGSQFVRCKFAGKLGILSFRGWNSRATDSDKEFLTKRGLNLHRFRNPMDGVDFSQADLGKVEFLDDVDITKCVFPNDRKHIVIFDGQVVHNRAKREIEVAWSGSEREEGLDLLDELMGPGDRHTRRLEEGYYRRFKGKQLEDAINAIPMFRQWHQNRFQRKMYVIHREEWDKEKGPIASNIVDLVARIAKEVRPASTSP